MDTVVTRFPPSPTGYLHIGGARTALFNWLYARKTGGRFILRIEDTDEARSTKESVDAIFKSLEWLGIDWDEGPFFQTQRYDIYKEYINKLVASGHAYYCDCSPEEVNAMREKAKSLGKKPMYNGKCRELNKEWKPGMVVRLKAPAMGTTVVEDVVKGNTAFPNSELDDFIIQRSDGSPMYNLAVVVDDITMGINTIIRGDDHLVNTPKQMLIYKALEAPLPLFAHVPMVLGSDKARLSKRHGAMSVSEYMDMGYLPDAMLNYLVRLGWSFGDQEFFRREELIEKFSLEHIGRSPSMFDMDKLTAINAKHIQDKSSSELAPIFSAHLAKREIALPDTQDNHDGDTKRVEKIIETLQPRSKTMVEMADAAIFYFRESIEFEEKAAKKFINSDAVELLKLSARYIKELKPDEFTEKNLEDAMKKVMEETGLKFGKIAQPLRVALTGGTVSPGIFEMILALGQKKTVERIQKAIEHIQ
ncbi:Glutamyl-tRNA synthetase [Desulfamplus magnetovallimortis]|uniref:Glutamate--tRNA ligase n=1 Tax=Desulfamplus magnetovallimortis TaxID=1246637 RepID=A0A1W1HA43_9BACT|nr:glutamate--tRNA ligase [Desulfamplus magnetovallimortis]SLM29299.1 Glutamyl-tRNA synthetase [Desulfamplus magnetovallimortis]